MRGGEIVKTRQNKTLHALVLFAVLALAIDSVEAQALYRWEDKDGRVTYSDMPPPKDAKLPQEKKLVDNIIEQDKMPFAQKAAAQSNPVVLYASNCGEACAVARALLSKRGIPFAERNPESDAKAAASLNELTGALDVPTMTVGANTLKGFSESAWMTALDTAGYPRTNGNLRPAVSARGTPQSAGKDGNKKWGP